MKYYGKAEQVAQRILTAFESPELLPNALAAIYMECGDMPSAKWSYTNRIMMFLFGTHDARGYRQWQAANRHVKKGGTSFPILVPLIKHVDDNSSGDSAPILYGFKSCSVFGYDQTDGEPLPEDARLKRCIDECAFIKVSEKWHIPITAHNAKSVGAKGYFAYDKQGKATPLISLGVMDMSTWAHDRLRFIPGSHHQRILPHRDTFAENSVLSRGQEIDVEIDEDKAINIELKPGQVYFHHGRVFHASGPNCSDYDRVGLVFRFLTPRVRQLVSKRDYTMLVHGIDTTNNWTHIAAPLRNFNQQDIELREQVQEDQSAALAQGAKQELHRAF